MTSYKSPKTTRRNIVRCGDDILCESKSGKKFNLNSVQSDGILEIWSKPDNHGERKLLWADLETIGNGYVSITYTRYNQTIVKMRFTKASAGKTIDLNDIKGADTLTSIRCRIGGTMPGSEIILPKGIVNIGCGAFANTRCDKVKLPPIEKIPVNCFRNSSISQISGYENVKELDVGAFSQCKNLKHFDWPQNVHSIYSETFHGSGIEDISGIDNVTYIGGRAFADCKNLKHFDFPPMCTEAGMDCFRGSGLETVSGIEHVSASLAFDECPYSDKMEFATISNEYVSITYLKGSTCIAGIEFKPACTGKTVDMNKIDGIEKLTNINLSLASKYTGTLSIKGVMYLTNLILPRNLKNLPKSAFQNSACRSIVLPERLEKIPECCFASSDIEKIDGTENITGIGKEAFKGCKNLKHFAWPKNCHTIPMGCFLWSGLETLSNYENVKEIRYGAFEGCKSLKSFIWPKNASVISPGCFENSGLEEFSAQGVVDKIGPDVFKGCKNLKKISGITDL